MAEANWYWTDGTERNGPEAPAAIARMVADGKLGADDLLWKEGMADWIAVSKIPALAKHLKQPAAAAGGETARVTKITSPRPSRVTAKSATRVEAETEEVPSAELPEDINTLSPAAGEVGYYNPSGDLPPRAAASLAKHARPLGDVGDWPLDDARVMQFDQALKLRKRIDGAAGLFRLCVLLMVIADIGVVIGAIVGLTSARGPALGPANIELAVAAALFIGLTVLYYFAWKGTVRSHKWAPLTMGILFVVGGLWNIVTVAMLSMASSPALSSVIGLSSVSLVITGAFAWVAFRAFLAIPKYLRQPAWCQELLSKTSA